jgi:hypothetical protein
MRKAELREEIARLTKLYLSGGGAIEIVPSKKFLTPSCKWMAKYGWDYLPWLYIQDDSLLGYTYWLGDGRYLTKPQYLED